MIRIREGEPALIRLATQDLEHLTRTLGRDAQLSNSQILVRRLAGLWALPSGETLIVEPRKGSGVDLFAWMCAVDPRLVSSFRGLSLQGAQQGGVAEVAARVFSVLLVAELRRHGARRQYREKREWTPALRGRVDWAAYAREALPVRIPCVHWERDLDTPLNRLFSAVLHHLRASETLRSACGTELSYLLDVFGHIPAKAPVELLDLERPLSRGDAEYEAVRRLAVVLLDHLGVGLGGDRAALSFQVNLARLFEQSVELAVLTVRWTAPPVFQARPPYEGELGERSAIDVLVSTAEGPLVIDAKYASRFSKEHLYQVLAYMKMVGSRRGVLVYPTGAEIKSWRYRGTGDDGWEVRVVELDPMQVGVDSGLELSRVGTRIKEFSSQSPHVQLAAGRQSG